MDRFTCGLRHFNVSRAEIERGDWVYSGGSDGRHFRYWKLRTKGEDPPPPTNHCVCGHFIKENCYIENASDPSDIKLLILGNCCIKRFLPKQVSGRTCGSCRAPHRNRKDNFCNECRTLRKNAHRAAREALALVRRCASCENPVQKRRDGQYFKRCYPCSRDHVCPQCRKIWVSADFIKCYACKQKLPECAGCNDTGNQYWCDGIFGWCTECGMGYPDETA